MKTVGELLGPAKMQLPFAVGGGESRYPEPHMEFDDDGQGTLATVKGDVHDIGKNLSTSS